MSVDLLLDERFQPVPRVSGDAALIEGDACFLQALRMEAAGSEGDLWYALEWGWSLLDFKGAAQDELVMLEIEQRVRQKLSAHEEISPESIAITANWADDSITIDVGFRLLTREQITLLRVNLGKTGIEVVDIA